MPSLDLVALWEAHCRYEFDTRDVDATMATMVSEPYVNHIPTITGGVGHDQLKRFYKYHIYWDQASVLVQVGLLDPAGLPVAGAQTARKVMDKSQPSNELMARWATSEGKPI
jgi:hypothetical protein